jgi:purine-binding chemotaxis protein CheW
VVVEVEGNNIGMIVDAVSEVVNIPQDVIEQTSNILGGIDEEYLTGVAKLEDKLVILLDLVKVLRRNDGTMLENFC